MVRKTLSGSPPTFAILILAAGIACLWSNTVNAQTEDGAELRRGRFAISAGFDVWADINELHPQSSGAFDSSGLVIDFAAHWMMKRWGTKDLLFGLDVGGFSHDSDVFHIREDLISRGFYLTPSAKLQFGTSDGPRYSLDVGLGYYLVDIAELDTSVYYGYYCCYSYSEEQLWEDSSFGGFIGTTIDFGKAARRGGGGFTMGARIHWLDLGTVRDEGRLLAVGTLGPDAGRLRGPVYSMQFGYVF